MISDLKQSECKQKISKTNADHTFVCVCVFFFPAVCKGVCVCVCGGLLSSFPRSARFGLVHIELQDFKIDHKNQVVTLSFQITLLY